MTFTAYIQRQKNIIRNRHEGETFLLERGEVTRLDESQRLLQNLSRRKGLNTRERMSYKNLVY